jgi:predicted nucleic acid-binding protein
MTTWLADTAFYLALLNRDDALNARAVEVTGGFSGHFVTTAWVVTELADALSRARFRATVVSFILDLRMDRRVTIEPPSEDLLDRGFKLYGQRFDKDWSLTDCISFVVMEEHNLTDALTADHHFEQTGFNILLK